MLVARVILLVFGLWASATSVIFIKESTVHPVVLAGYRLLFAALFLLPMYATARKRWGSGPNRPRLWRTLALAGVLGLTAGDYQVSRAYFTGDLVCLGSMVLFAAYLVFGRKNRDFLSIWLYVVPLYAFSGLLCILMAIPVTDVFVRYPAKEYLLIFGLALLPTIAGHSIFNYSLRHFRGQVVSVANLTQFIFAGVMAYVLFDEVPGVQFYAATATILAGALITISASGGSHQLPPGRANDPYG